LSIYLREILNIRQLFKHFLPAQPCFLCGADNHNGICCAECAADLPRLTKNHCPICALPTFTGEVCGHCLREPPKFDRTVAVFSYGFPLNKLVQGLKFNQRLELTNYLADELAKVINERPDAIVAMPLHPTRLRERGFNQSQLLAQRLAHQLQTPCLNDVCQRTRHTTPQTLLPWKERNKNVHNAFACATHLGGKRIAIIDDVMTTGASLNELAKVLKQAGANRVEAWVVARTLPH
jgi:ComF family protein